MDPSSRNKRQKMSGDAGLISLPDGILASVGEYLALPSRALFAATLTAPSSSWGERHWTGEPSAASRAVLPPECCNNLDFAEVEKKLATSISDDDIGAALACLDAVHSLHTLKLAHCLNITGRGLEPLRGSAILQFVDLSMVGQFESPEIEGGTLSETIVISVLQSIIDAEGSALKYLALPSKWKAEKSEPLAELHRNYAQHLYSTPLPCAGTRLNSEACGNISGPSRTYQCDVCSQQPCLCAFAWFGDQDWECEGAFQNYTCYDCGGMFCEDCRYERGELQRCHECEKPYCDNCRPLSWCENCGTRPCSGCDDEQTTKCCGDCRFCYGCEDWGMTKCDACGEGICTEHIEWNVTNEEGESVMNTCSDCKRTLCSDCCKIQHCRSNYCCSVMCNDCQPEEEGKCLWCDKDDENAVADNFVDAYERRGPRCTECFKQAKTHCHYCRKKKLREEDYLAPPVPSSYWTWRGYDDAEVKQMETFLREMKVATLKLKSGDTVHFRGGLMLRGEDSNPNGTALRFDAILLPHWQEFANALRQYEHGSGRREKLSLRNVELHSSVLGVLMPALQEKNFMAFQVENVASSTNGIQLAVSYVRNNPMLEQLELNGLRVDKAERLHDLFAAVGNHPLLNSISFKSMCGASASGHYLLPLAFSLLHGTKTYKLDLSSNNIRTNGATDIPDFIAANNPRLKSLCLMHNKLDDSDALLIANELKKNNTLERIELRDNDITEVGGNALRSVVFDSTSVKTVVNSNHTCSISDAFEYENAFCNIYGASSMIQHKIYYLISIRNEEGSNGQHLGLELRDASIKLVPNLFGVCCNSLSNTANGCSAARVLCGHFLFSTRLCEAGNCRAVKRERRYSNAESRTSWKLLGEIARTEGPLTIMSLR